MKRELKLFFTALQFYTRIPIPGRIGYVPENLSPATRYLPLIGWLAGTIAALTFIVASYLIDVPAGIVLSMIATILLTGAFHEDGFADACDGFGGGWTKEKILVIMKDSRIGTYGAVGLILILGLKFSLLFHIAGIFGNQLLVFGLILINAHTLSRFTAATVLFSTPYARDTGDSKVKPVAQKAGLTTIVLTFILSAVPLFLLINILREPLFILILLALYIIKVLMSRYFVKWIGGYTGDCLGAVQQVCEIVFYFLFSIVWKFI